MGSGIVGEVVKIPFPFSDLTDSKSRPAVVVANLGGDDLIVCMITSQAIQDPYAVSLAAQDFSAGGLRVDSQVRPSRIFTADSRMITERLGLLTPQAMRRIRAALAELFSQ